MRAESMLTAALVILGFSGAAFAVPAQHLEERTANVCRSGIYGELAPILQGYPIAQAFCSAVFPVGCTAQATKRDIEARVRISFFGVTRT